jgi:ABC-type lipoprotein export system ATPase subunit
MKVKNITVYGLLYHSDCNLDIGSSPLTFIYSANGFGKTTLLKALISSMEGDVECLEALPFDRIDIGFSDGVVLIVDKRDGIDIMVSKNEIEHPVDKEELNELFKIMYISPERQVVIGPDGHLTPAIDAYADELRENIRNAVENNALVEPKGDYAKDMSDGELVFLFMDLKAKLDYMKGAGLEPDLPSSLRFPPTHSDVSRKRDEYEKLAFGLEDYIDRNYRLSESIVVSQDIMNRMFRGKTLHINEKNNMVFKLDSGADLPLNSLSSGEKNILVILYRLLFQAVEGSIVVIDEPENSLHIEWQQRLGDIFLDIAELRNLQFIVATHSPQIIHDKWDMSRELRDLNAENSETGRYCE